MAAYISQTSNPFSSLFLESQNSENNKRYGGESSTLYGVQVDSNASGSGDRFEYGFMPHGESGRIVSPSSSFYKNSREGEIHRQFEERILKIFVHHATGIHNICIYDNQDVYAKFCFSHNPDESLCSRVVKKGGKNPVFNETLQIAVEQADSVLKCEIWMSSIARSYLEDQLLGFVLIPMSSIIGKGKLSQDYCLSSTDLLHSNAGTLTLTLTYLTLRRSAIGSHINGKVLSSDALGASLQLEGTGDRRIPSGMSPLSSAYTEIEKLSVCDYSSVEFQDLQAIAEDEQLVSSYLSATSSKGESRNDVVTAHTGMVTGPPFLQLFVTPMNEAEYSERKEEGRGISFVSGNCQLFSFSSTPVSDAEKSYDEVSEISEGQRSPKRQMELNEASPTNYPGSSCSRISSGSSNHQDLAAEFSAPDGEKSLLSGKFEAPSVNISIDSEPKVVQQDIVDMYMTSMQQFTAALGKMQLLMDMDSQEAPPARSSSSEHHNDESGNKNSQRVFYGSRAFF